jgi:hypothetical protein
MDRFFLYDATFPTQPSQAAVIASAETEEDARTLAAAHPDPALTWVEFQIEENGVGLCNGVIRRDLGG